MKVMVPEGEGAPDETGELGTRAALNVTGTVALAPPGDCEVTVKVVGALATTSATVFDVEPVKFKSPEV
jgi:hypothetical protein